MVQASGGTCSGRPVRPGCARVTFAAHDPGAGRTGYMQRDIFTADHEAFRDAVRSFIAKEVTPLPRAVGA